jgi:hypothetical protein
LTLLESGGHEYVFRWSPEGEGKKRRHRVTPSHRKLTDIHGGGAKLGPGRQQAC